MTDTTPFPNGAPFDPGFRRLRVVDWRQFDSVNIDFHPRLTILTGANATGKSTVLGILARHFNWSRSYSTSPIRTKSRTGQWVSVGRKRAQRMVRDGSFTPIGSLVYGSGYETAISVPVPGASNRASQYDLILDNQQLVTGAFLTSHRSVSGNYVPVASIPTTFADPNALFEQFTNEVRTRWSGGWTGKSPQLALKEALMSAAVFSGEGNSVVEYNADASAIWQGFQRVLHQLMPATMGYRGMRVRIPDLVIESETGDFIIDDASGGLTAIIELAWQIFLRARSEKSFTVLLDEPENHLHPSLQREFLPNLLSAFPMVQFIVATHSPFVVTATPDSAVYALTHNGQRRVESRMLDYANKAASADETLREVLGVSSTIPSWAEHAFSRIISDYGIGTLTEERLRQLRRDLAALGLEAEFPTAVLNATQRARATE